MDRQYNKRAQQASWKFKTRLSHCEIWENAMTRMIVQAYPIDNYERTHARINRNKSHLVNTHGAVTDNQTHQTYLLVERIPSRLSQITNLSEAQTLKVLLAVLRGLDELEQIYGLVGLTENSICFNEQGKVKIWINSDLSSLHPVILAKDKSFSTMIQILSQIVNMISLKCFNETFLNPFIRKLHDHRIYSFIQAAEQILRIGELLFIDIEQKPKSYSKYLVHREIARDGPKTFHQDNPDTSLKMPNIKMQPQLSKNSQKTRNPGHSRHFSGHEKSENMDHKRSLSYVNLQKGKNENLKQQKGNCETFNFSQNSNKFAKSQTYDFKKFGETHKSVPQSPREGSPHVKFHKNYFQKQNQHIYIDQICKKMATKRSMKDMEAAKILQKTKPLSIKTSLCPNISQQIGIENSLCQNIKNDKLQVLIQGEFQTFGILEDSSDKRGLEKTKDQSLDRNQCKIEGTSDLNLDLIDLEIQKTLEKKKKEKKDRLSIMEQIQLEAKKNNAKGLLATKEVKELSIFCSELNNNKQNIRQKANHQAVNPFNQRFSKDKTPSFTFIDQKYEQYIHTGATQKRKNENQLYSPRVVNKYSMQSGCSGDSQFFSAKTPFFSSKINNFSAENLSTFYRPLNHY